jgi:hypothetical protein
MFQEQQQQILRSSESQQNQQKFTNKFPDVTKSKELLPERSIQHQFHLFKFGANPEEAADESIVKFMANSSAKAQFLTAPPKPKSQPIPATDQPKPIETSTFSEQLANEEVNSRNFTKKFKKFHDIIKLKFS